MTHGRLPRRLCLLPSTIGNLQESENLLKDSLRAEAGARRARTRQRIAARAAERAKELQALGRSEDEIKAEEATIRAAGEGEQQNLEAVSAAYD